MLIVNNKIINANIIDIVTELKEQLWANKIYKLKDIKPNGNNIQITCPNHKDGMEKKPSAGITIEDNGIVEAGTVHCFTCGYTTGFAEFISNCFGYQDGGRFGSRWLSSNFSNSNIKERHSILGHNHKSQKVIEYVSEEELSKYRFYHPYMYKRKLTDEIIELFDIGFDNKTKCITFPTNDENGNCLFITRRSVEGKFFNYPGDVDKPVYALDKIPKDVKQVVVCESIINALTCWVYGEYAVALLGTGTQKQYDILRKSHIRKFVLAFDGDSAGDKASIRFKNALNKYAIITKLEIPRNKDVNDLSKEEYFSLKENYF